jgi:hypothetical protein
VQLRWNIRNGADLCCCKADALTREHDPGTRFSGKIMLKRYAGKLQG